MTDGLSDDTLLGGRVRLKQPKAGYRAAIDPVLLAAAVPAGAGETVLDVGAGAGAATLCLATRVPDCRIVGIEMQRELARLATENAALNGVGDRVEVLVGDLMQPPPRLAPGSFDHVMSNPPHHEAGRVERSPDDAKALAAIEGTADLAAWVGFCIRMVKPRGTITIVHRADRLDALIAHLYGKAGAIVVFPLWPDATGGRPARRVIVQARKGAATPAVLAPGLALHEADGRYTPGAEAILRDAAAIEL